VLPLSGVFTRRDEGDGYVDKGDANGN